VLAHFDVPISYGELFKRTFKEMQEDDALGLAAQLAYYFFLALFPTLLFLIALAGFLPAEDLVGRVVSMLQGVAPQQVISIIRDQLTKIAEGDQAGLLSFGVVAALWSSSAAMVAIISALNRAYDVEEARPWWKQRLMAIVLTIGVSVFLLAATTLVVAGPELADFVTSRLGMSAAVEWTWKILQWPLVFLLVTTAIGFIYYFAPDVDQDWVWITPGSLLATVLWLIGSLGFRAYVVNFGSYNETYGAIGGVIVLMLWLYLSGLVIIIGAEMNSEIEHASPHGKDVGEKTPGQRRSIGPRAERQHRERVERGEVPEHAPPPRAARRWTAPAVGRVGVLLTGLVTTLFRRRV
jgi:membrane protein